MSEVQSSRVGELTFNFRTKDGLKRSSVNIEAILPTSHGLIEVLSSEDNKQKELIVDLVASAISSHIRGYVENDLEFNQESYNALLADGKVDLAFLANLPKSERNTISKENLEDFAKDYIAIMPEVTNKDVKRISSAAGLFVERFKRVAGDNAVLAVLQQQLEVFVENAPDEVTGKHERVISYLADKLIELQEIRVTADAL